MSRSLLWLELVSLEKLSPGVGLRFTHLGDVGSGEVALMGSCRLMNAGVGWRCGGGIRR